MRLGHIGDGELSLLLEASIRMLREAFMPVPDLAAQLRLLAKLVVQANFSDAVNIAQAFGQLEIRMPIQAPLKRFNDLRARVAQATRPAHRQDERPAKLGVVVLVELLELGKFLWAAVGQTRFALLVGRFRSERVAHHRFASELGVGADQADLRIAAGERDHLSHGVFERSQRGERPLRHGGLRNPRRMLIDAVQQRGRLLR